MSVANVISKIKLFGNIYQLRDNTKAPIDSPVLTGTPMAPTPLAGDSSDKIATTAFVMAAMQGSIRITIKDGFAGLRATATLVDGSYSNSALANSSGIISIPVDTYGKYIVTYSDVRCHGDNEAVVSSNLPVELAARFSEIIHYTLRIDETNSNPETACVYMNDAVSMTKGSSDWDSMPIFNDLKPCVFKDGKVNYYLRSDNFGLKENGDASDLTGTDGDVMIEVRKFGYKITREGQYLYVDLTNDENAAGYCYDAFSRLATGDLAKFYQGAYKGYIDSNGDLRSIKGVQPTASKTIVQFRTAAQKRNTVNNVANTYHYQQATYAHLVALQCLFLMKYGTRNGQTAVGKGIVSVTDDSNSNLSYITGYNAAADDGVVTGTISSSTSTDSMGMYGGSTANGITHVKLFGIEDFWGNIWEWVDGLTTDSDRNIITSWNNFANEPTETTTTSTASGLTANSSGWINMVSGTSQSGFMPVLFGTQNGVTTGSAYAWPDYGYLYASCVLFFGGRWANGDIAGPFLLDASLGASYSNRLVGGRLSYN